MNYFFNGHGVSLKQLSNPHSCFSEHSFCRTLFPVISHHSTAPCPGTPVSLCLLIMLHQPSHHLTISQSSPVSPFLLHHLGSAHVGPSPCLSSWGSRTHTLQQPPDIHLTQRVSRISACHASLCLCPESCFTTFSLSLKSRDLRSITQKVLNRVLSYSVQNYCESEVGFSSMCFPGKCESAHYPLEM